MNRFVTYTILIGTLTLPGLIQANQSTGIERLPAENGIRLSTQTQTGQMFELQVSTDLESWSAIGEPQAGTGEILNITQPLVSNSFYRFRSFEIETAFAPILFPFDMLEEFGIFIPGFEEEIVVDPPEENKVAFEVEMHTDPENFIGVNGEFEYTVHPENPNIADFLITYRHYTTRNSTSGDTTERSPEQQAAATNEAQIKEIFIIYVFESPNSGSSTTINRYTDGSEEMFDGEFEIP
ncbi:MAG: hypothetical protein O7C75_16620 [Verrucomicrobia bacterium]|nr:hypothetical protein [Verrucomicrobiota bacterium]